MTGLVARNITTCVAIQAFSCFRRNSTLTESAQRCCTIEIKNFPYIVHSLFPKNY
jgi:hypothetical protein